MWVGVAAFQITVEFTNVTHFRTACCDKTFSLCGPPSPSRRPALPPARLVTPRDPIWRLVELLPPSMLYLFIRRTAEKKKPLLTWLPCAIQYGDAFFGAADMRTGARHGGARKGGT